MVAVLLDKVHTLSNDDELQWRKSHAMLGSCQCSKINGEDRIAVCLHHDLTHHVSSNCLLSSFLLGVASTAVFSTGTQNKKP